VAERGTPSGRSGASRLRVPLIAHREPVQLLLALLVGGALAVLLLGGIGAVDVWRVVVLPVALLLVLRGLLELVALAGAEWRRERPGPRRYLLVVVRFLSAYLIVAVASG